MRKKWILIVFAIVLAASLLSGIIAFYLFAGPVQKTQSWMFVGAYATYEGKIDSFSEPYTLNATITVTNVNVSYVQILTNSTIAPSFSVALTDKTVQWINKTNVNFQHKGETLVRTYNTLIPVKGAENRSCIVNDYTNPGGINASYYLDQALQWPLRIIYVTAFENQTYTLEFNLKNTNIKELN